MVKTRQQSASSLDTGGKKRGNFEKKEIIRLVSRVLKEQARAKEV